MLGPQLLVASVVEAGQRTRRVYLPKGPEGWMDFWTGERHRAGTSIEADAPLWRVPLFVPDNAIIPLTDTLDFSRLHDEPSRQARIHPGLSGEGAFSLYEDDGISHAHRAGDFAEVHLHVASTRREILVCARTTGEHALPYESMRVVLPPGERRRVVLRSDGIALRLR
jgi:alpha-glucosidase